MSGITNKGQVQYLNGLKAPQEWTYLFGQNFSYLDKYQYFIRKYLKPSLDHFIAPYRLAFDLHGKAPRQ